MKDIYEMGLAELAAYICDYLSKNNIQCVLSGGACVSIYSKNNYQSYDIDLIEINKYSRKDIIKLMKEIGFEEKNRYFVNPKNKFFVEFPTGPLAIGSEPVNEINQIEFDTGILKLLSPTDCIKDRLSAYYF